MTGKSVEPGHAMGDDDVPRPSDLDVDPEIMLAIRDRVREGLVHQVHELRMVARLHRKVGNMIESRRLEREIDRLCRMIAALPEPEKKRPEK